MISITCHCQPPPDTNRSGPLLVSTTRGKVSTPWVSEYPLQRTDFGGSSSQSRPGQDEGRRSPVPTRTVDTSYAVGDDDGQGNLQEPTLQ